MSAMQLEVKERAVTGKAARQVGLRGAISAVLYGHGIENQNLEVDYHLFSRLYETAGESTLVDLKVGESKPVKVIIQDVDRDPVTNRFIHIDFYQVRMDEKIHAEVELEFTGEAPAVKELAAILVTTVDTVEVSCLPNDLVHKIAVDLSSLRAFGDAIRVSDLAIPSGVTILEDKDEIVAMVQEPRKEIEPVVAAAPVVEGAAEAAVPESVEKPKAEKPKAEKA